MEEDKAAADASETGSAEIPSSAQIEASEPQPLESSVVQKRAGRNKVWRGGHMVGTTEDSKPITFPIPDPSNAPVHRRCRASADVSLANGVTLVRPWTTGSKYILVPLLIGVFASATSMLDNPGKLQFFLQYQFVSLLINVFISICILLLDVMNHLLVYPSLVCLLIIFAHPVLWPEIGMLVAQLSTHYSASFFGYVLARRTLLANKVEAELLSVAPMAVPISARLIRSVLDMGVAFRLVWLLIHADNYTHMMLIVHCLISIVAFLMSWIIYMVVFLGDSFIGEVGLGFVFLYIVFIAVIYLLVAVSLGEAVAIFVTCFVSLGLSGLLGYSFAL